MSTHLSTSLPQRVMRRATAVAIVTVTAAIAVGLFGADEDIDREVTAAMALAATLQHAAQSGALDDAALLEALRVSEGGATLRHLNLDVRDADGRLLLSRRPETAAAAWVEGLAERHPRWGPGPGVHPLVWSLARPGRAPWTLTLTAAPQSERRESIAALAALLGVLAAGALAMLLAMTWTVRRALGPLATLSKALSDIRPGDATAAQRLPPMPVPELQTVRDAIEALGLALDQAEADRRLLAQKVHSLQEDERARLARDLHDEFGQRLTALRLDASLLQRQLHPSPTVADAADRIAAGTMHLQDDVRMLLRRLAPRVAGDGDEAPLGDMLRTLAEGWRASAPDGAVITVDVADEVSSRTRGDIALALYRLTQEALTNAARHARATQVTVRLRLADEGRSVVWTVDDDGIGIADPAAALRRGSGLAGMRERVWAHGGDLELRPAQPDRDPPGLRLSAQLRLPDAMPATDNPAP